MANNELNTKVVISLDNKQFKAALKEANKESKEFKKQQNSAFKGVDTSINGVIATAKKWAPAFAAAGAAATKVMQTAVRENQTLTDEWARLTESAKASWEGFVNSLVTANFSGYLTSIDEIVSRAREAADVLDALGTAQIFTDKAMTEYDLAIRQARLVIKDPNSTAEERKAAGESIQAAQAGQLKHVKDLMNYNMEAFAATLAKNLATRNMPYTMANFIERGEDGQYRIRKGSDFEKFYGSLDSYNKWNAIYLREKALRSQTYTSVEPDETGRMTQKRKHMGRMSDFEYNRLQAFMEMSDEDLKDTFKLYQEAQRAMSRVLTSQVENFEYLRNATKPVTPPGGITSGVSRVEYKEGSIGHVEEELATARQAWKAATLDEEREYHAKRMSLLEEELELLKSGKAEIVTQTSLTEGISSPYLEGLNAPLAKIEYDPSLRAATEEHRANKKLGANAADVVGDIQTLSGALSSLGATISTTAGQTVKGTQVIGKIFSVFGSIVGAMMPGPIGAVLSGIGSIVGSFDTGGIIGGTSYKGDKLTAQVSAGEMILNRQQQRNLLDIAQGGSNSIQVTSVAVSGDKLVLAINNSLRGKGRNTIG